MGFKLGDISPIAGVLSGKGLMGKIAGSGGMGLIPAFIARDAQKATEDEEKAREAQAAEDDQREKRAQAVRSARTALPAAGMKKGGAVKKMASGGKVSSASKRADGIAQRGKTRA